MILRVFEVPAQNLKLFLWQGMYLLHGIKSSKALCAWLTECRLLLVPGSTSHCSGRASEDWGPEVEPRSGEAARPRHQDRLGPAQPSYKNNAETR